MFCLTFADAVVCSFYNGDTFLHWTEFGPESKDHCKKSYGDSGGKAPGFLNHETRYIYIYIYRTLYSHGSECEMAIFWVVAPCSLAEVYRRFGGTCCLHHQFDLMVEAASTGWARGCDVFYTVAYGKPSHPRFLSGTSETSVNVCRTTRRCNPEDGRHQEEYEWSVPITGTRDSLDTVRHDTGPEVISGTRLANSVCPDIEG
jgi:hypothetical protein